MVLIEKFFGGILAFYRNTRRLNKDKAIRNFADLKENVKKVGNTSAIELGFTCPTIKLSWDYSAGACLQTVNHLALTSKRQLQVERWQLQLVGTAFRNDPNVILEGPINALSATKIGYPIDYSVVKGYKEQTGSSLCRASADILAVSEDGRYVYLFSRGRQSDTAQDWLSTFGGYIDPSLDRGSLRNCALREFQEEAEYWEHEVAIDGCPILLQFEEKYNTSSTIFLGVAVKKPLAAHNIEHEGSVFVLDLLDLEKVKDALNNRKWVDSGQQSEPPRESRRLLGLGHAAIADGHWVS